MSEWGGLVLTGDTRRATGGDDSRRATRDASRNAEMSPRVSQDACRVSNPHLAAKGGAA